ncbi:MAG: hypothetical protein ABMA01_06945 [Chthoniobacteraceae bacterium]
MNASAATCAITLVCWVIPAWRWGIDCGDPVALHPQNKKPIGIRHAYLALKEVYGKDIVPCGPRHLSQKIEGSKITLEFDSIGSGMMRAKPGKLDAFAIAGADKQWHLADAEIAGNKVIVSSKEVPTPVAVRYAWAMNPSQRNLLYNQEGLPASPFRTDTWPLFDPNDPAVRVEKPEKTDEARDAKKNFKDWERPRMTQEPSSNSTRSTFDETHPHAPRNAHHETQFTPPLRHRDPVVHAHAFPHRPSRGR